MTNDFTGDFEMTGRKKDRRPSDASMPTGVRSQERMGDIQEQFRAVTRGFETMHRRVDMDKPADPMLELRDEQDLDDIQRDADQAAMGAIDHKSGAYDPVSGRQPLGSMADMDDAIGDMAGHEFDVMGER